MTDLGGYLLPFGFLISITQLDSLPIRQMLAYSQGRPWDIPQNDETCTILIVSINLFNLLVGLLTCIWFTVSLICLCVAFLRYLLVIYNIYVCVYIHIFARLLYLLLYCFVRLIYQSVWEPCGSNNNIGPLRGGSMLSGSIAEIKNFRGFVPQDDIVHEHLTVRGLASEYFCCVPECGKLEVCLGGVFEGGAECT